MTETWPCFVCEAPTDRGSYFHFPKTDEWLAVPLCQEHRATPRKYVAPGTLVIDAKRTN